MKTYKKTHPWISFELKATLHPEHWLLLGEAQSKCEHIARIPLLPAVANHLRKISLIKGALASTAIEGNTLTEDEARDVVEGRIELPPSKRYLGKEVENILEGFSQIQDRLFTQGPSDLTSDHLLKFNALVLRDLPLPEDVIPGTIRDFGIGVGRYRGAPIEDCEYLLNKLCDWLNRADWFNLPGFPISFGLIKAIVAHVYIAWIHPFGDGNGRTARLLEAEILASVGVPDLAAQLLSNHYNETRAVYYQRLEETSTNGGDLTNFLKYALQGFVDQIKQHIEIIQMQQLIVHWRDYVHDQFKGKSSPSSNRRRRLALDLTMQEPVPKRKIRHFSARIAEAYANKTDKTITRDLNHLETMGLITKKEKGYVANTRVMFNFIPRTAQPKKKD